MRFSRTMANTTAKISVQFIHAPGGDLAVLPRTDYDRLVALAAEAQEDAAASRIVRNSMRALKEGREVVLPKSVVDRLANGDSPIRVIREWRDMIRTGDRSRHQPELSIRDRKS